VESESFAIYDVGRKGDLAGVNYAVLRRLNKETALLSLEEYMRGGSHKTRAGVLTKVVHLKNT